MMNQIIPQSETAAYKSLLYWRKSAWIGSRCVPVILTLENKTLTMKDNSDVIVFRVDVSDISKRFTQWGTMVIEVNDKQYDIVGIPAKTSPAITNAQKAELRGLTSESQARDVAESKPVAIGDAATDGIGGTAQTIAKAATSTIAYYRGLATISQWKTLIGSQSDQQVKMNAMKYYFIAIVIVLIITITIQAA